MVYKEWDLILIQSFVLGLNPEGLCQFYSGRYNYGEESDMKVLGIMGSPRRRSNTDILLDKALEGAREAGAEVEKVLVSKLKISPCLEIYACLKDGDCAIKDDMQSLYKKLLEADYVIFASPMFFYGITSQAKAMIDRCQALWVRRHVLGIGKEDNRVRRGVFISVGATKGKKLFDGAVLTVKYFFDAIGVKYAGDLLVRGIDKKGQIEEHPAALEDSVRLGKELVLGNKDGE
jgi:multimeric flavodoxin WrbA